MFTETQRLHLLEEVLKSDDEALLKELEAIIHKAGKAQKAKQPSAHKFLGKWSKEYAELIEKAIEEGCEHLDYTSCL